VENRGYGLIFPDSHQDAGSAVFNVLQFLDVLASDPSEEGITVAQSGGDKAVGELLCIQQG